MSWSWQKTYHTKSGLADSTYLINPIHSKHRLKRTDLFRLVHDDTCHANSNQLVGLEQTNLDRRAGPNHAIPNRRAGREQTVPQQRTDRAGPERARVDNRPDLLKPGQRQPQPNDGPFLNKLDRAKPDHLDNPIRDIPTLPHYNELLNRQTKPSRSSTSHALRHAAPTRDGTLQKNKHETCPVRPCRPQRHAHPSHVTLYLSTCQTRTSRTIRQTNPQQSAPDLTTNRVNSTTNEPNQTTTRVITYQALPKNKSIRNPTNQLSLCPARTNRINPQDLSHQAVPSHLDPSDMPRRAASIPLLPYDLPNLIIPNQVQATDPPTSCRFSPVRIEEPLRHAKPTLATFCRSNPNPMTTQTRRDTLR